MNEEDDKPGKPDRELEWYKELSDEELEALMESTSRLGPAARHRIAIWLYGRSVKHLAEAFREPKAVSESKSEPKPTPEPVPKAGERLIGFFCRGDIREAVLGDLAEQFTFRVGSKGASAARWWYWRQVAGSAGAFTWRWMRRLVEIDEVLKRIGF